MKYLWITHLSTTATKGDTAMDADAAAVTSQSRCEPSSLWSPDIDGCWSHS